MIDQIRQVAIFSKTIDHGSFRGAAKELTLSPSVVSHHVSQLEEHLGVALIYRSTRKLTLTKEGERLLARARPMLETLEAELADISGSARDPSGELRMTVPSVLAKSPLSEAIAVFSKRYPRIRLILNYSDERKELIDGRLDIAIRMATKMKRSRTTRVIFSARRRLVASVDFASEKRVPKSPEQVEDWQWLALYPAQSSGITFQKGRKKTKIKPAPMIVSNDAQSVFELVRTGVGVAVIPEFLATEDVELGLCEFLLPDWEVEPLSVYAEWPSSAPRDGLISLFIETLNQQEF